MKDYIVFSISSNKQTAKDFARFWNCPLGKIDTFKFVDDEDLFVCDADVSGKDVLIIESTAKKPDEKIVGILKLLDSVNKCEAKSITLIIPYLGYSAPVIDDKHHTNGAQVMAKILETGRYDKLITIDLYNDKVSKYFSKEIKNIHATKLFASYYSNYLKENGYSNKDVVVVSIDNHCAFEADQLLFSLRGNKRIVCEKIKSEKDNAESLRLVEDVKDKICIVFDDVISSGNIVACAVRLLIKKGAKAVLVGATHGLFAPGSLDLIKKAGAKEIVITNTVEQKYDGVKVLDILPIIIDNI